MFAGHYAGRRVLVTGHTGFKGSWLVLWLRALGARVAGLALAPDTEPSHWRLLAHADVRDAEVDLRDADAVRASVLDFAPQTIFHLAAQPLVRRSYREPAATFATNVQGLVHLFEAVRECPAVEVLVNATTDKVYAEAATASGYAEGDPLGGHDPYSASKACAEIVGDSYRKSFFADGGPRLATARAGNVIGGGDWSEDRLVPDLVRAAQAGRPLQLRHPDAVRPWQHVLEPLSGYLALGERLARDPHAAGAWNFGPGPEGEVSVRELAARLASQWPALAIEPAPGAHPHEAAVLRLDTGKARRELGWIPVWGIDDAARRTAAWYREFEANGRVRSAQDLEAYVEAARAQGQAWAA
jgi:CDP-glucose 4,6-dehydratase